MSRPVNRAALFASACVGMTVFGGVGALLGAMLGYPEVRARFAVDFSRQGDLFAALYSGLLATTLVAGPLIDRFGNRLVLLVSALVTAGGFAGFAGGAGYAAALTASLGLGIGGGGLNIATNTLVSGLYPEHRGRWLSYLAAFFGVGALLVPLVVSTVAAERPLSALVGAAGLAALSALAFALLAFPPGVEQAAVSPRDLVRAAGRPGVPLLAALLFFQTGNEASIGGWITTYIGGAGWDPSIATRVLVSYWVAVMLGRAAIGRLHAHLSGAVLLVVCGALSVAGCAWLMGARSLPMLVGATLMTSIALSGVYPTTLAMAGDRYRHQAGTVFGVLFSTGAVGGMVLPPILGRVSEASGLRAGLAVPLVSALAVTVIALVIRAHPPAEPV